jgi:hypothetical protein
MSHERTSHEARTRWLSSAAAGLLCALGCGLAAEEGEARGGMEIDGRFPGGNIIVEKIEGDTAFLRQDLRDTAGDWFYWCFRVRGAARRTVTFCFTRGDVMGTRGPACSTDGGKTWAWLGKMGTDTILDGQNGVCPPFSPAAGGEKGEGAAAKKPPSFRYAFPADANEVRFCFAIPYLETNLKEFLAKYEKRAKLKVDTLCKTKKGRAAEVVFFGPERKDGYHLAFMCRHHACESLASYELEGLLDAMLAEDETGRWYGERVAAVMVPFVDKDGVEDGDQGKNRRPHDHNRDYAGDPAHPTVAAIRKLLPEWSGGKLDLALDLHCPSRLDSVIQFIGGPDREMWARVQRLSRILEETKRGPLPFSAKDDLPYGKSWNTSTGPLMSFGRWASQLPGTRLATTIEFPYATAKGEEITPEKARLFGRDLAVAIRTYLEKEKNPAKP